MGATGNELELGEVEAHVILRNDHDHDSNDKNDNEQRVQSIVENTTGIVSREKDPHVNINGAVNVYNEGHNETK